MSDQDKSEEPVGAGRMTPEEIERVFAMFRLSTEQERGTYAAMAGLAVDDREKVQRSWLSGSSQIPEAARNT